MNYPTDPLAQQRRLSFQNVSKDRIPGFAVIGPQTKGSDGEVDAVRSDGKVDFVLRLGRASAVTDSGQDASLYYISGPQSVEPQGYGKCYQQGMMQALIGYPEDSPPAWGDGLSIDTSQTKTPFYLIPGAGAYKFIDFDGCPKTTFKDSERTGYKFKVGWIVPTSQSTVLDGAIIKDDGTLATLEPGGILPFWGRDNPALVTFGLSKDVPFSSEAQDLLTRGFYRIHTTGHYLLTFTARIRGTESDINTNIPSNLVLTCRTNRINNTDEFYTADQTEELTSTDGLSETGIDYTFHSLAVGAEDQPADTNKVDGETVEVHRHWQAVSGSTVLRLTEGELFFIYNSTLHTIEVSGVSGTLVLLSGTGGGSGGGSTFSSSSSSDSSGGSTGGSDTTELNNRITTVESDVHALENDLGTLEATVTSQAATISSHTASITANASAISDNADAIVVNAAVVSANSGDIAALEAIFAGAIADGTYTTATGDEITVADGVVTTFTPGPFSLPSSDGTSGQAIVTDGSGNWTFQTITTFTTVQEIGATFRPVVDSTISLGDATRAWVNGYFDAITLAGTDLNTRIAAAEDAILENGNDILTNVTNINTLAGEVNALQTFQTTTEAIFSAAIADGTNTTGTRDEITTADGLITGFTQGPVMLPATAGTNTYFLRTNGDGTTAWAKVVHQNWSENGSGHLVPDTNNIRDVGTSSLRVRQGHFQSLYIGGTQSAAFSASHILQLSDNTSAGIANANDIAALEAIFAAGIADDTYVTAGGDEITTQDGLITGFTPGSGGAAIGHTGLKITRGSTTQLTIAAGRIHNHDVSASIIVATPITLDLTDSGDFVNSSSRATSTWYHVLIGHLTSDGSVVAALSTTLAKPAAWDDWQMIGAWRTNATGSGQWDIAIQTGNRFTASYTYIAYNDTTPGAAEKAIRAWCPPMVCSVDLQVQAFNPSGADYAIFRNVTGGPPVTDARFSSGDDVNMGFPMVTDSSGNVYHYQLSTTSFSGFMVYGRAFEYPIGEAGAV